MDAERHFENLIQCIELESAAEAARLIERRKRKADGSEEKSGETLLDLVLADIAPALGDRYLATFTRRREDEPLPWNRLRSGTPVVVSVVGEERREITGVVSRRSPRELVVVVNAYPEGNRFRLDRSADEVTRRRQLAALAEAQGARGRVKQLREILLHDRAPRFREPPEISFVTPLNPSQQEAVRFALAAEDLAIIHGPPGTGKTTTVVELILQAVQAGQKVLATGPSNTAVDNLLERLARHPLSAVRLGHPARVAPELQDNTLDALVARHENMAIAKDMQREAEDLFRRLDRHTRARPPRGARLEMRAEAKQLKSQARLLEKQAIKHLLERADVICATTTGDNEAIKEIPFDLAVVDEACQSTEPGCWIPVLLAERIVLSGDHFQLPPTVLSSDALRLNFDVSLMERLASHYGDTLTRRLTDQYRMHQAIMDFSSQHFYDGALRADPSVAAHRLTDLEEVSYEPEPNATAAHFIDTAGAGWEEELEPNGESKLNPKEGELILKKAQALVDAGLDARDMAVIAPYAAQVRWLREHCTLAQLEIDTVDGFQGREKEAVLISLVRSNSEGEIGFLADARRMNVALTRARRKLLVVGDSATLSSDKFFFALLEYFESIGGYHTVWEEL